LEQLTAKNARSAADLSFIDVFTQENQRISENNDEMRSRQDSNSIQSNAETPSTSRTSARKKIERKDTDIDLKRDDVADSIADRRPDAVLKDDSTAKTDQTDTKPEKIDKKDPSDGKDIESDAKLDKPDEKTDAVNAQAVVVQNPAQQVAPDGNAPAEAVQAGTNNPGSVPEIIAQVSPETTAAAAPAAKGTDAVKTAENPAAALPDATQVQPANAEVKTVEQAKPVSAETLPQTGNLQQPIPTSVAAASYTQAAPITAVDGKQNPEGAELNAAAKIESTAGSSSSGTSNPVQSIPTDSAGFKTSFNTAQIAEPARMAEARVPEIIQQIAKQLEEMRSNGQTTLRLQLFPESMGRIDLKMTSTSQGIGVSIIADQSDTNQLLQRNLENLRQSLTQAGVQLNSLNVSTQGNFDQSGAESRSSNSSTNIAGSNQASMETQTVPSTPIRALETSVYDYRI
jgi:flagellar hook-length control protein FliK